MRFCDLGPLQVQIGDELVVPRGRRLSAALSAMLINLNRRVSVDLLLDAVWADDVTAGATSTLETHIWRLRKLLEPDRTRGQAATVLINDSGGYRLVATVGQVDSARFEQLALDVLDLVTTEQPLRALKAADQALELWRGEPFVDVADRPWAGGPIARLTELRSQLVEQRVDAILGVGRPEQALSELESLLAEHPLRERLWWQRMLALYRCGRTDDALTTFRTARRTLLDEVGVDPGAELIDLQRRILDQDPTLRPVSTSARPPAVRAVDLRLPRERPMVGRDHDLRAVRERLELTDLVTIAGAAGCGKTLLAVEAARAAADRYPDGVCFVDLSAADQHSDVAVLVAAALDLAVPAENTTLQALLEFADDRQALVVLDNCEQVLDQVAELAELLTQPGRQVALLTTSREPLGVPLEEVLYLEPLASARGLEDDPLSMDDEPAVVLFLTRARLPLDPPADQLAYVREICRAVDGIPLAVELAAALVRSYSLTEIADQVERDPGQLAAIGRGQAHHHQTLTSAIERSHRLLGPEEQMLHRRLAVLPASFGRSLAEAVAGEELQAQTGALLARLVHRSLLGVSRADGEARFAQLAPVRAHAARALRSAGEVELAEDLRDGWIHLLVMARPLAGRPEEGDWYAALNAELPALRTTLQRHLVTRPDEMGVAIVGHLIGYWFYEDLLNEGIRWSEAAVRQATGTDFWGVIARLALADLLAIQLRVDRSQALIDEAVALIEPPSGEGLRLRDGAQPLDAMQERWLTEMLLSVASSSSTPRNTIGMRRLLDLVAATGVLEVDTDFRLVHGSVSTLCRLLEDVVPALDEVAANFDRADEHQNLWAAWMAAATGASIALSRHDARLGLRWSGRVIDRQGRLGGRALVSQVETYGDFLALDGRLEEAVRIFAATHHQSRRVGREWPRNPLTDELLEHCRVGLSAERFAAAWAIGPTLSRRQLTQVGGTLEDAPSG